jgi:hypothetical protein
MFYSYEILDKNDELNFELFVGSVTDIQSRIKHESIKHKAVIEHSSELDGFHTICFSQTHVLDRPTVLSQPSPLFNCRRRDCASGSITDTMRNITKS